MNKKTSQEFCDTQRNEKTLHKTLKVVNKPQGKLYAPGINLQGKYLNDFNFFVGEEVAIEISRNRILVEKVLE